MQAYLIRRSPPAQRACITVCPWVWLLGSLLRGNKICQCYRLSFYYSLSGTLKQLNCCEMLSWCCKMRRFSSFSFTITKAPASVQSGTPFSACVRSRRTGAVPLQAAPVGTAPFPKPEIDISILLLLSYKPFSLPPIWYFWNQIEVGRISWFPIGFCR